MGDMKIAIKKAREIATDDSHGYSQENRWGKDYDCSSLVITCLEEAGFPVKSYGGSYTGNLKKALIKAGFENVVAHCDLNNCKGLHVGDILLTPFHHVAFYNGNHTILDARSNENKKATGGKVGDQTGEEIQIHKYYNFPWSYVYRYPTASQLVDTTKTNGEYIARALEVIDGKWGVGSARVTRLTAEGYNAKKVQKIVNALLLEVPPEIRIKPTILYANTAIGVCNGFWGTGSLRKKMITTSGYYYPKVQNIVNALMK